MRDNYVLDPTSSEAEVNPALRHHLKQLYNLDLPESMDLKETTLDQFYENLKDANPRERTRRHAQQNRSAAN